MQKVLLEVCCGRADDVIEAHRAGADRVELNSDLFHGGLTPTLGSLLVAKRETGMPIMSMVRNMERIMAETGCSQFHLAAHRLIPNSVYTSEANGIS